MSTWEDPAAWYEVLNPWGPSDDFYLSLVMSADRVLDVGCGTGRLLHRARDAGHTGRLCGLDPDPKMLDQARIRKDIDWVPADAASAAWNREFDLVVMASHAFQVFVDDSQLRESLAAIRAALVEGGLFAFETRHPRAGAWEGWNTSFEVRNPDGEVVRVEYEVHDVKDDVVFVTESLLGAVVGSAPEGTRGAAVRRPGNAGGISGRGGIRHRRAVRRLEPRFADGRERGDHHDRAARRRIVTGSTGRISGS